MRLSGLTLPPLTGPFSIRVLATCRTGCATGLPSSRACELSGSADQTCWNVSTTLHAERALDALEPGTGRRTWFPNLSVLVSYGLIEKAGESSRGGRRAYYRFSAKQSIKEALTRLGAAGESGKPRSGGERRFHFIAAGDSGEPGSDIARRSADIEYEPRSWR